MLSASLLPAPRAMARSMVSRVMLAVSALSTAARNRGLSAGTGPPNLAATVSSRISLVNILPRLASCAALRCLIFAHLGCPAMKSSVLTSNPVLSSAPRHAAYALWERACSRKPPTILPQTSPAMAASSLLDLRLLTQTDAQFAQRLGIYRSRGLGHDTGGTPGFREGNRSTARSHTRFPTS